MNKWKLIKALLMSGINIALVVIIVISIREFFVAELIVDKIHYGVLLLLAAIICFTTKEDDDNSSFS